MTTLDYVKRHYVPKWRRPDGRLERIAFEARAEATAAALAARG